jgi:hypothetical protein
MKRVTRFLGALAAAAILSATVVSCGSTGGAPSASAPAEVKYKCACGKEKTAAAGATAPQ